MHRTPHDPHPVTPTPQPQPEPDTPEPEAHERSAQHQQEAPPAPDVLPRVTDPDAHLDGDAEDAPVQEQPVHLEERYGESPGIAEGGERPGELDVPSSRSPSP